METSHNWQSWKDRRLRALTESSFIYRRAYMVKILRFFTFSELMALTNKAHRDFRYLICGHINDTIDQRLRRELLGQLSTYMTWGEIVKICKVTPLDAETFPQITEALLAHPWLRLLPAHWADVHYQNGHQTMSWFHARWLYQHRGIRCEVDLYPRVCMLERTNKSHVIWDLILMKGAHLTDNEIMAMSYPKLWPIFQQSPVNLRFGYNFPHFTGYTMTDLRAQINDLATVGGLANLDRGDLLLIGNNCNDTVANIQSCCESDVLLQPMLSNPYIDAQELVAAIANSPSYQKIIRDLSITQGTTCIRADIADAILRSKQLTNLGPWLTRRVKGWLPEWEHIHLFDDEHAVADVFALIVFMCDELLSLQ